MPLKAPIPSSLGFVRAALYAFAGISVLASAGLLLTEGAAPLVFIATFILVFLPGAVAFLLAMLIPNRGTVVFWGLIVFGVGGALAALASFGGGLAWIIQMLIPTVVLVFGTRQESREYLLER